MLVLRRILVGGFVAVGVACGSEGGGLTEPGVLTITLSGQPPALTNSGTVQITGQVVRTPAAPGETIVVTVTGAPNTVSDTAAADGSFSLSPGLTLNAQNQLTVSASDESGSSVTPISVTVRHDGQGPGVTQVSPANAADGVTAGTIVVTLNERLSELVGAGIAVSRQGATVTGTVTISADSLTLTFTPSAPFEANKIHNVVVGNFRDALGNVGTGAASCFVTAGTPTVFNDPSADASFVAGSPGAALAAPDLIEIRVQRVSGDLLWLLRFSAAKSLAFDSPNNFFAWLDLDVDEDGGTGFLTVKDSLLGALLPASGAAVEYAIAVFSQLSPTDSSGAGPLSAWGSIPAGSFAFVPDVCAAFVGFTTPLTAFGGDDGGFRVVSFLQSEDATGARADAAPDGGFYDVNLLGPLQAVTGPGVVAAPGRAVRSIRRQEWRVRERQ